MTSEGGGGALAFGGLLNYAAMVRNKCERARIASAPSELGSMYQCYTALPYLIDFEAGRGFREARDPLLFAHWRLGGPRGSAIGAV